MKIRFENRRRTVLRVDDLMSWPLTSSWTTSSNITLSAP